MMHALCKLKFNGSEACNIKKNLSYCHFTGQCHLGRLRLPNLSSLRTSFFLETRSVRMHFENTIPILLLQLLLMSSREEKEDRMIKGYQKGTANPQSY